MEEFVDLLPVIIVALVLWMAGLSIVFWRLLKHYQRITKKAEGGNLLQLVDVLVKHEERNSAELARLKSTLNAVVRQSVVPIQKVGFVRFNPFDETGGDQSFSLCLLDGNDTGFVLTALHTRDRTRVYTKPVNKGESKYELSVEERKALMEGMRAVK